ncbi:MAG: queuine tRNA-ribosyltransferase family protein [Anaerolineaceae bacterium]|nr:queuine tRNA-ribosyltransferase family protein [Anaerolineaceae bacterium]
MRDKKVELPVYMPDATYGYVRALTSHDLRQVGLPALMMNAFHLMQKPGSTVIQSLGGLHKMADWKGLIMTDSGGFQAYSMIRQNPKFGSLTPKGIIFRPENSNRKLNLSPEKSIQLQFGYGSDVLICLDDCTHINASYPEQKESVERTIAWAKLAKQTYLQQLNSRKVEESERPLIFGVIQGGAEADLRRQCAEALLEIGFDGFGFGGWPLDEESNLITDILELVRSLIPQEFTIHALGIGHPESIVTASKIGYEMFDSALPTRDARHGRLYRKDSIRLTPDTPAGWLKFTYINTETFIRDPNPIEEECDCPVCQDYSLGYLYHLYKMRDPSYFRLATMHNLRFMTRVIADLKESHGS